MTKSIATLLVAAAFLLPRDASARTELAADTSFYVATSGSDANDCLASSTPCLTIQHVLTTLQNKYDLAGYKATVSVGCTGGATYATPININGIFPGQTTLDSVSLIGDVNTPANCLISIPSSVSENAISLAGGARMLVKGFALQTTRYGLFADDGGTRIEFSNMEFRSAYIHMLAHVGGRIIAIGNYSITGGGNYHMDAAGVGAQVVILPNITVSIFNTPSFATFALAIEGGLIDAAAVTFTGSGATGARYAAEQFGLIATSSGNPNYFPGDLPGVSTGYGGLYS